MSDAKTVERNRDIRAWARSEGIDIGERGRIPPDVRDAYSVREFNLGDDSKQPDDVDAPEPGHEPAPASPIEADLARLEQAASALGAPGEVAPVEDKRRRWGRRGTGEDRPAGRRVSLERIATHAWGLLGMMADNAGAGPVSRVLSMQAPVAGVIIEDGIKGTFADRVLQPLARMESGGETAFALFGPAAIVAVMSARPETQSQLYPFLVMAMESWVDIAGPRLKKEKAKRDKRVEEFGASGIEDMIRMIFTEPVPANAGP